MNKKNYLAVISATAIAVMLAGTMSTIVFAANRDFHTKDGKIAYKASEWQTDTTKFIALLDAIESNSTNLTYEFGAKNYDYTKLEATLQKGVTLENALKDDSLGFAGEELKVESVAAITGAVTVTFNNALTVAPTVADFYITQKNGTGNAETVVPTEIKMDSTMTIATLRVPMVAIAAVDQSVVYGVAYKSARVVNSAVVTIKSSTIIMFPNLFNLTEAITAATKEATDAKAGSEPGNYGQADIDNYKDAIVEAQKIPGKSDATQADVDAAVKTLARAKTRFELTIKKELVISNKDEFYNLIKNALENCETTVKVKVLNYNNSDYNLNVINQIVLEHPDVDYGKPALKAQIFSYGEAESLLELTFEYEKDVFIIKQEKEVAQKKVQEVLKTVINNEMTDFEKELAIHDYIVKTADYDVNNYETGTTTLEDHTAYGVLVNKLGVCESYAKAMYELLNGANIECKYVTGYSKYNGVKGGGHAWNMVKLEDGWYNLDTTWDDPISDKNGSNTLNKETTPMATVNHTYFNVPDSIFNKDHIRGEFEEKNYPKCTATKYSYENMDVEEYTADGEVIAKVTSQTELDAKILDALKTRKTVLSVRLSGLNMNLQQLSYEINKVIRSNNLNIGCRWSTSMPDETHVEYTFKY
ncbi:hypothetical protein G9F71_020360 [Clostridium sp. FP2]|uniref:transglutaminase domain-containing protein n=1 Tax=Clostridium sp. FP2 TaxID=2724481 RepID=UPI0013E90B64|nr:transglutaminase domain-containing protein [Clostridium sp. FP2]MBZ9625199.1 hypothetical protein [Clostridium sp. FP2]